MSREKCSLKKIDYDAKQHIYQPGGYNIDYELAREMLVIDSRGEKYSDFCPAYIVSTEHYVSKIVRLFDCKPRDVLTVAASGDQAMFYAAAGVQNIDTFDMSFCAKVIQDLKTSALGQMNRGEYDSMLKSLYSIDRLSQVKNIRDITDAMPADTAKFALSVDVPMFVKGVCPLYEWERLLPNEEQYMQMQTVIKRPFNFIWSDIADLHIHLHKKYDVINVSNVFDWINKKQLPDILKNLFKYLNVGGYIVMTSFGNRLWTYPYLQQAEKELRGRARLVDSYDLYEYAFCMYKVR